MWELGYNESWAPKNWCFWTVLLKKTLESPLDCKEIQPVHPQGDQSWIFIGRTDAETETPIIWPPDAKNWLIWKGPDAGKDWRQEEKVMTEDEIDGWLHWLNGHEFEKTPGVDDGQGGLVCCSPWCHKESDASERLKWTDLLLLGFPNDSVDKEPVCNVEDIDVGLIPGSGRSLGGENGNPPQDSPEKSHRQRSLGYSPKSHRVRQDWVTKQASKQDYCYYQH